MSKNAYTKGASPDYFTHLKSLVRELIVTESSISNSPEGSLGVPKLLIWPFSLFYLPSTNKVKEFTLPPHVIVT